MNRKNLLHLIETLQKVQALDTTQDHRHFDMSVWAVAQRNEEGVLVQAKPGFNECGTSACALGWEALTPYANRRGLHLRYGLDEPVFKDVAFGIAAAVGYFDLPFAICCSLFLPHDYTEDLPLDGGETHCIIGRNSSITPQDVIDRITVLLAIGEQDYLDAITPVSEGF